MDLKDLTKTLIKNKITILVFSLAGLVFGGLLYLLPSKYIATGSIFVGRITDKSNSFFTYEGYYGQQTAMAYTNSVLSLVQSTDLLKDTLTQLNTPVDDYQIWKLKNSISAKKAGPQTQVINMTVSQKTADKAENVWNLVYNNLDAYAQKINNQSDPALKIYKVSDKPVIRPAFKFLPIYLFGGMAIGLALSLTGILVKEYFKEGNNK